MTRTVTQICTLFLLVVLAVPAFAGKVLAEIEYFYSDDGTLIGKAFNGNRVNFEYDLRGQLLAVKDAQGKDLERYTYDPACFRFELFLIQPVKRLRNGDQVNRIFRQVPYFLRLRQDRARQAAVPGTFPAYRHWVQQL